MTIASTTSKVSYNGNGSTDEFTVPYYFLADADLVVTHVSSAGVETTLTITTEYTVAGAGDPDGGTVTLVTPPATGEKVIIKRSPAQTQETDYVENAAFPATSHEMALDRLTMCVQDVQEQVDRAVLVPISSSTSPADLLDELAADVLSAAASAATATTQAGLAATAKTGAETAQGLAEDASDLAQEWAVNPEDQAVTGYPGEYSALHWAAKSAASASGGAFKVSADDTTAGYLEGKLALISNSGLVFATTNPAGNEVRTLGIDLDTAPGLALGAGGIKVEAAAANLALTSNARLLGRDTAGAGAGEELTLSQALDFIGSAAGGDILYRGASAWARLPKGTDGQVLTLASGLPAWAAASAGGGEWTPDPTTPSQTASTSASIDFTGLNGVLYDYRFVLIDVKPATNAATIYMLTGYDSTTWRAHDYTLAGTSINQANTVANLGVSDSAQWIITPALSTDNEKDGVCLSINCRWNNSDSLRIDGAGSITNNKGSTPTASCVQFGGISYTNGLTGIRFIMSSGNIASGTFLMYRRTK